MDLNLDRSKITKIKIKIKIQDFSFSKISYNLDQIINSQGLIKNLIMDFKITAICSISFKVNLHLVKEVDLVIINLEEGHKIVRIF